MTRQTPTHDDEFRKQLTPDQFHVCREGGTEPSFSGTYVHQDESDMYHCVACGNLLFSSDTKFDSGTGWPSFWDIEPRGQGPRGETSSSLSLRHSSRGLSPEGAESLSEVTSDVTSRRVTFHDDISLGMHRTEVRCARCSSHLGHVFNDGPQDKTGLRYCINSVALDFKKKQDI